MRVWKQWVAAICPRCNHSVKDDTHILEYLVYGAVVEYEETTIRIKEWMETHDVQN